MTVLLLAQLSGKRVRDLCGNSGGAIVTQNPCIAPENINSYFRSRTIHVEAFYAPFHAKGKGAVIALVAWCVHWLTVWSTQLCWD